MSMSRWLRRPGGQPLSRKPLQPCTTSLQPLRLSRQMLRGCGHADAGHPKSRTGPARRQHQARPDRPASWTRRDRPHDRRPGAWGRGIGYRRDQLDSARSRAAARAAQADCWLLRIQCGSARAFEKAGIHRRRSAQGSFPAGRPAARICCSWRGSSTGADMASWRTANEKFQRIRAVSRAGRAHDSARQPDLQQEPHAVPVRRIAVFRHARARARACGTSTATSTSTSSTALASVTLGYSDPDVDCRGARAARARRHLLAAASARGRGRRADLRDGARAPRWCASARTARTRPRAPSGSRAPTRAAIESRSAAITAGRTGTSAATARNAACPQATRELTHTFRVQRSRGARRPAGSGIPASSPP